MSTITQGTGVEALDRADGHYTIITADSHAGGSHAAYREYLDPKFLDEFDAWRGRYKNPFKDLGDTRRFRNWDDEMRNGQQEGDGVVGEVIFPNTVPPFFPSFVLFAGPPKPEDYEKRLAGIRAHNRWLVDFCEQFPERRAGIGQVFLNDIDDAIEDVKWIKDHGLRGGILIPNVPPDAKWVRPLYDPEYDRFWEVVQDLEVPVNVHGGTGAPDYGNYPFAMLLYITEVGFYSQRPLVHLILGGVFERFPQLKLVITETGCSWVPPLLKRLDAQIEQIRSTGQTGEIRYGDEHKLNHLASEYFQRNVWMGVSQPGPDDVAVRHVMGPDRFMWGSDYPHDEGTHPFTREHLRQVFPGIEAPEMSRILAENAAKLYDFDLNALAPLARQFGPTVEELAQPLDALPENPNEALLRGAGINPR
ncbi:MAG TPA: amidohydrolase family protein [Acidimicrobiales bacterium]|jgi:predicted TIM-barrel fold metal-dependent hydrolase|nr:amidohydrolase family protein [Acidimicrobiales bacterium]